jgi:hypothetical protein
MMSITAFGSNLYAFFRDIDHDLRSTRKNIPSTAAGFGSSSWKPTLVVAAAELILGSTQPSQEPDASMDEFEAGSGDETYEKHCGASVALFTWPSAILLSCFLTANQEVFRAICLIRTITLILTQVVLEVDLRAESPRNRCRYGSPFCRGTPSRGLLGVRNRQGRKLRSSVTARNLPTQWDPLRRCRGPYCLMSCIPHDA